MATLTVDPLSRIDSDSRRDLYAIEARIVRQRDALLQLMTHKLDCEALPATLSAILEVASATLDVRRVSIWRYNAAATHIDCLDAFDAIDRSHVAGAVLSASACPIYFGTLAEAEVVAATDAALDPRTRELAAGYLLPLGITSMLDVPVHLKGAVTGVLCHEHIGKPRRWTEDEKAFAIGVSNLIALAFERCERSRAESALALQGAALNAAANAVVITERDGTIVWANPAFTELTGYTFDESVGFNPRDLIRSGVHDRGFYTDMWTTLSHGRVWHGEITNRRKDGSTYLEDQTITPVRNAADGSVTHFVAIKRDLTQHRQLETQFLQAQKMEVVGRLAGGIAHDFNNILTVINGSAELAIGDLPEHHPIRNDLQRIHESGKRAASLTRQLLAFSRKEITVREPLDVSKMLNEFRGILQRLIGEDIRLDVSVECAGTVIADQSQFEQVILNLAVNARDAMPVGGTLRIAADNVDSDDRRPGQFVRIIVADTGCGIPPEVVGRIFEPFFTTKAEGKGTGLGLSTVYAITQQNGGTIEVESRVGEGTTFTLYWPRVVGQLPSTAATVVAEAVVYGGESVLLVEDDDTVRELAVRVLRSGGYRVLTAGTAAGALNLLQGPEGGTVDLLVTDVVLPGPGGRQLASLATAIRPQLRVLYTSGYTDDTVLAHGVEQQAVAFLSKPYTPAALLNKVRAVLLVRS